MTKKEIQERFRKLEFFRTIAEEKIRYLEHQNEKQSQYLIRLMKDKFEREQSANNFDVFFIGGEEHRLPKPINWSLFKYSDGVFEI